MALGFLEEGVWDRKVYPVFRLLWQVEFARDTDFIVRENLVKILLSTVRITILETKLLNFRFVFFVELDGVKCLIGLLPDLHYKEVSI